MRHFSEQEIIRREKVKKLNSQNISAWAKKAKISDSIESIKNKSSNYSKEELHQKQIKVSTYGRLMSKRGPFSVIFNNEQKIQVYVNKKENENLWNYIDFLDLGDIFYVEGFIMKTNTGEVAIKAINLKLLSKSLKVLPEKFHGLKDVEERHRHRYADLIVNKKTRNTFRMRSKIVSLIRQFFENNGYLEVETPVLVPFLSGANAKPFITHHNALSRDYYLRIATELPLKKLIVGGFNKVFEIGRLFRNEGVDTTHNPEFTTIEFYEANSDVWEMMDYTETLIKFLVKKLELEEIILSDSTKINLTNEFKRIEMSEAVSEIIGFNIKTAKIEEIIEEAKKRKFKLEKYFEKGHLINLFFEELVEPTLIEPTFVFGHPKVISPFAVSFEDNPDFTERAELFIGGKEYANMFSELSDPIDQLERFESQLKEREAGNDEANEVDWDFVEALEYGMPPAGGCGIGIDRLAMLLTNNYSIREVLLFPHLKEK